MNTEYIRQLRASQAALSEKADAIIKAGEKRGHFTDSERKSLKSMEDEMRTLKSDLDEALDPATAERAREDQALLAQFKSNGAFDIGGGNPGTKSGHLAVTPKAAKATAANLASQFVQAKSLVSGTATATVVTDPVVAEMGTPPTSLLEVLPLQGVPSPTFRYMRHTVRDINAATVAPGETKPTSSLGLQAVDERLRVVAHLSEPLDVYAVGDVPLLQSFVQAQLIQGLYEVLEQQVIDGDGQGENLLGLSGQSGIQTQAFTGTLLETVRRAATASEVLGYHPNVVVMSPQAWQDIELATTSGSGAYHLESSPVNRAERRIWGMRVVTSTRVSPGVGYVIDTSQLTLYTDTRGVQVRWSESHGDSFAKNEVVGRFEGRFALAVHQPMAHVTFDTTA